ncbi:MAG: DUF5715 family protein [bacterium]|nr:DUF5715 family protein [bacterium]
MLKKRIVLLSVVLIILSMVIFICTLILYRASIPSNKLKKEAARYEEYKKNFSQMPARMKIDQVKELKSTKNDDHVEIAIKFGVSGLNDENDVLKAAQEKKLIILKETNFWKIKDLEDSLPYVTPDTLKLLQIIGQKFHENLRRNNLPLYRFTISSVLRTEESQRRLVRKNRNATRKISSHQFGTSVDIVFKEFDYTGQDPFAFNFLKRYGYKPEFKKIEFDELGILYAACLRTILGETLLDLQKQGLCYVIYELRQPVFHITVATKM